MVNKCFSGGDICLSVGENIILKKYIQCKSICHQWFNLNFIKRREYFLYAKKKEKNDFFSTIRLLSVSPRQYSAIFITRYQYRKLLNAVVAAKGGITSY